MQELDGIQLRSNTKDARAGRNTNTSILVAADMHATETMNQQWCPFFRTSPLYLLPLHRLENKECPPQGHSLCTRRCSDMEWHISAVDHKTTRLCIALSAHGSTRAKCIRSNGRLQIRSNTKDARTCRREHPTAQRPNTLQNKIQATINTSYPSYFQ